MQRAVVGIGLGAVFASSLVGGLMMHLDDSLTRRVVATQTAAALDTAFAGDVTIGDISRLTPNEITVEAFTIGDHEGEVLALEGVTLHGTWLRHLLVFAIGPDPVIVLPHLRAERVRVDLRPAGEQLAIVRVFQSATPTPPRAETPTPFLLRIPNIEIGHGTARGSLDGPDGPQLDAELHDLAAALGVGSDGLSLRVEPTVIRERALLGVDIDVELGFRLERRSAPGDEEASLGMGAQLRGNVGPLAVEAEARMQDGEVRAHLKTPRVGRSDLKPWVAVGVPLEPVAAEGWVVGTLPQLSAQVTLSGLESEASVSLHGTALLDASDRRAGMTLRARDIDLQRLDPSWPPTHLSFDTEIGARIDGDDSELLATLSAPEGSEVDGQRVPALEGRVGVARAGTFTRLVMREAGFDAELAADLRDAEDVDVSLRARTSELARVRRLADFEMPVVRGRVVLQARGHLRGDQLDLGLDADGRHLLVPAQRVAIDRMKLGARLRGPWREPERMRLRAHGHGMGADVPDLRLGVFSVSAAGPLLRPAIRVTAEDELAREVRLAAQLDGPRRRATDIRLSLTRGEQRLSGRVKEVGLRGAEVVVDGIELFGLGGDVDGGLVVRDGEIEGRLHIRKVELAAIGHLLGRSFPVTGSASVDVDLQPDGTGRKGYASIFIDDLRAGRLQGVQVEVRAAFEGETITPFAVMRLRRDGNDLCGGDVAAVVLTGRAELPGRLLDPASWSKVDGGGAIQLQRARLECLVPLLRERLAKDAEAWPIGAVRGMIYAAANWRLVDGAPSVPAFGLQTVGLVLDARAPAEDGGESGASAWQSDRLDLSVEGSFHPGKPSAADTELRVSLIERRPDGVILPVVRADVTSQLDLPGLTDPARREDVLRRTEVSGSITLPKRNITRLVEVLPAPFRDDAPQPMGDIEGQLFMAGPLGKPNLGLRLSSTGLGPRRRAIDRSSRGRSDVDVIGSYSQGRGRVDVDFRFEGQQVLAVNGQLNGSLIREEGSPRRTGTLEARLLSFPLGRLPVLAARGVAGELSGDFRFDGLGRAPRLTLSLRSPELTLGKTTLEGMSLSVAPDANEPGMMSLSGRLPVRGGGLLTVTGFGGLAWEQETYPRPAKDRPARLDIRAEDFPLSTADPFVVSDGVGGITGLLDGELVIAATDLTRSPTLEANLVLRRGGIQLPGQELREVQARIVTDGSLLSVKDFEAELYPGKVEGHLDVVLKGLEPLLLRGALAIDENAPVPVIVDGVPLGRASGTFSIRGKTTPERFALTVDSDDLIIALPGSAQRNVQSLEPHPDVRVSHPLGPPGRDDDDTSRVLAVTVALRNAEITSGNVLDVKLSTSRPLQSGVGPVTGEIELEGGSVGLLGKRFTIDRGVVRLDHDHPGNPDVNVTAHWDAPDGTTVFIDYIGRLRPLTQDKIRFRSSPPRAQQALITLILLGNPDEGVNQVAEEGGDKRATNLGQGVAAMQINQLLGEAVPGLSTSLSTTEEDRLATTVKYRLTDAFTAAATVETTTGTTETSPEAGVNGTKLSVDYRFLRYFLVRGSVGIGNGIAQGLDLLFQYRF